MIDFDTLVLLYFSMKHFTIIEKDLTTFIMGTSPGPCSLEDLQQLSNGYSLILNCDICTSL